MKFKLALTLALTLLFGLTAPTQSGAQKVWWIDFPWSYEAEAGDYVCSDSSSYPIPNRERYTWTNDPLNDWCSTVRRVGYPVGFNHAQAAKLRFFVCYVLDNGGTGSEYVASMEWSANVQNVPTEKRWAAGYLSATAVKINCPQFLDRLMR